MKTTRAALAAMATLATLTGAAQAQDWPTRPITLIVPFSAGGGVDASARLQALVMGEILGQTIVVENVGAAAGTVGTSRVAKATPDGYTMLIGNSGTQVYSQWLYKKRPYDSVADFEPVGIVTESPRVLVARKGLPVNNLQEFIAYAKANQDKMQYFVGRRRLGHASALRAVQLHARAERHPCALSRRRPGPAGRDRRPHRLHVHHGAERHGAIQAGRRQGLGGDVAAAHRGQSGPPHHRRAGRAGHRGDGVERLLLPEGHAEADHREDSESDRDDSQQARDPGEDGADGSRNPAAGAAHGGVPGAVPQAGHRALGQGDQGGRDRRGLSRYFTFKNATCVSP